MFFNKELKEIVRKEREDQSIKDHLFFEGKLKKVSEEHTNSFIALTKNYKNKIQELTEDYEDKINILKKNKEETVEELKNKHKKEIKEITKKYEDRTQNNNKLYKEHLSKEISKIDNINKEKLKQQSNKIKSLNNTLSLLEKKVKSYKQAYDSYENLRSHLEKMSITTFTAAEKSQIYSAEIYKQLAEIENAMEIHKILIEKLKPKIKQMMDAENILEEEKEN